MTTQSDDEQVKPTKTPKQKVFSIIKTILLYGLVFILVYSVINWWRQPVMPADPQLQLTDYQGQSVDLAGMSADQPTLIYFGVPGALFVT